MAAEPTAESVRCELLAETIRVHGKARLRVQGTSMLPSLWPGDVLQVERRVPAEVGAGAIILYLREQRLFAHRLLKKDAGGLVARGDRLPRPDPPLLPEELLGEVTWVERGGRGFAPARRAGWTATLLRLASRFSDLPAGLLLRLGSASDASAHHPELVPETDAPR
jgi:hypothetical protein